MNKKVNKHTLIWLWKNSGKSKFSIFLLALISSALSISGVLFAWFFREIVDNAVAGNAQGFWTNSIILLCLIIFNIVMGAISRFLNENTASNLENTFKGKLFSSIVNKDYATVTSIHSGEWMNRLTSDTTVIASGLTTIIPDVLGMIVRLIGAVILMLMLVPEFVFILVPAGILLCFVSYIFRKYLKNLHKKIQEADGRLRVFMTERLSNLLIIKSFVKEKESMNLAKEKMQDHKDARMKRNWFANFCNIGLSFVFNGAYIICAIYCGYGILINTLSYGTFVAVLQLVNQIQVPFSNITGYLPKYYATVASAERLMEIENYKDDTQDKILDIGEISSFYENDFSAIDVKDICFKYKKDAENKVINNFNLKINKGDFLAITGISGIGKTTILKLLMQIYQDYTGECLLITKDKSLSLTPAYRRLFAYVPQGNYLMSGTIKDVVSFNSDMSDDIIWKALDLACASSFVGKLDEGLSYNLGENGSGLSEGQMQRIAIARAIASAYPILILDECTSSLDIKTEAQLLENIKSMTDKTVIIVTHRKKALEFCDKKIEI